MWQTNVLTLWSSRCVITAEAVLWLRSGDSSNRQLQNWGKLCSDASDKHSSEHNTSTCDQIQLIYTDGNIYGVTNVKKHFIFNWNTTNLIGVTFMKYFQSRHRALIPLWRKNIYINGMIYRSYICIIKQSFFYLWLCI